MRATSEQFMTLAKNKRTVDVPVPELGEGVTICLRIMGGTDRDRWDRALSEHKENLSGLRAVLVSLCAVGDDGQRMFTEEDVKELGEVDGIVLHRLYKAAWDLNKIGGEDVQSAAKNLPSGPSESSGSTSPEPS